MLSLLLLNFIIPGVMLLCSFMLKKMKTPYPGPAINQIKWKVDFSGYNTPLARKSREHWDYAQAIAPDFFLSNAKAALWIAVACTVMGVFLGWLLGLTVGCILGFGCMIEAFVETEKEIKKRFET